MMSFMDILNLFFASTTFRGLYCSVNIFFISEHKFYFIIRKVCKMLQSFAVCIGNHFYYTLCDSWSTLMKHKRKTCNFYIKRKLCHSNEQWILYWDSGLGLFHPTAHKNNIKKIDKRNSVSPKCWYEKLMHNDGIFVIVYSTAESEYFWKVISRIGGNYNSGPRGWLSLN